MYMYMYSQISKLEHDLEADWSRKLERTLTLEKERHERTLQEARDEKRDAEENLQKLEQKVGSGSVEIQIKINVSIAGLHD